MSVVQNQVCYRTLQFDKPWTFENYLKVDGYKAWRKILKEKIPPDQIIEEIKASGLRGRGGAGRRRRPAPRGPRPRGGGRGGRRGAPA